MPHPRNHSCWPLTVAGVLRSTCSAHWWRPALTGTADDPRATR